MLQDVELVQDDVRVGDDVRRLFVAQRLLRHGRAPPAERRLAAVGLAHLASYNAAPRAPREGAGVHAVCSAGTTAAAGAG